MAFRFAYFSGGGFPLVHGSDSQRARIFALIWRSRRLDADVPAVCGNVLRPKALDLFLRKRRHCAGVIELCVFMPMPCCALGCSLLTLMVTVLALMPHSTLCFWSSTLLVLDLPRLSTEHSLEYEESSEASDLQVHRRDTPREPRPTPWITSPLDMADSRSQAYLGVQPVGMRANVLKQ